MKKLVLGMGAAALATAAAFANEPTETQLAAVDNSPAAFSKLDMDKDGRLSAIEAANDSKLAAAFTRADTDRDGYLSSTEFRMVNNSRSSGPTPSEPDTAPPADTTEPPPQQ